MVPGVVGEVVILYTLCIIDKEGERFLLIVFMGLVDCDSLFSLPLNCLHEVAIARRGCVIVRGVEGKASQKNTICQKSIILKLLPNFLTKLSRHTQPKAR